MTAPRCCNLCHQGRRLCPTPEACRVSICASDIDGIDTLGAVGAWALVAAMAAVLCAVIAVFL